jgi:transcriptional regulator with XRE-family HTH domain
VEKGHRPPSPFGQHLRRWRERRGLSQLLLAAEAGTTPRHVSFLETGRSRPGRELVLRLAASLDVPLRERNALLHAAGLAPEFPALALTAEAMRPIADVVDRVLRGHDPYPAWVYTRGLRALASNRAGEALFPGLCAMAPEAIVDLWFAPGPFRETVENWQDVAWAGVHSLRREAQRSSDSAALALLRRAEAHAQRTLLPEGPASTDLPVVCPRFRIGGRVVRTVSTVLRFDSAVEVTTSELRVELMFPGDAASDAFFRELAS